MADFDFVVAGAGLAGACAARRLADHGSVLVIEKNDPASGGSGAAAGLVNPILGLRARPVWRIEEAVEALDETVELADAEAAYRRRPTLRPARNHEQAALFHTTAAAFPQHCRFDPEPHHDWLRAPHGVLRIETGGAIDLDAFVGRLLDGLEIVRTELVGWKASAGNEVRATVRTPVEAGSSARSVRGHEVIARFLILALGRGYTAFPEMMRLRLHQVKGQTVRMSRPGALPTDAPHVAGSGYVASGPDGIVCGSTYEHAFRDLRPSRHATRSILEKVERMVPAVREAAVLEERAGVRVTVPGIRLPMVGPLPSHERVWILTGLGAKGLLTAPLVAKELHGYLDDPGRIPVDIRVRSAK